MIDAASNENQILHVSNFHDLIATPYQGSSNAICWQRDLVGDYDEILDKLESSEDITEIDIEELLGLQLSQGGQLARETILSDLKLLEAHGASPVLNVLKKYERDDSFFSTDVYSFHVDRSPIPTDTFLCTYVGESSDIAPNSQAIQKILIPELRAELKMLHDGTEEDFETFLTENFFDLHYQANTDADIISLGQGNLWKLAVDHPESDTIPCLHRAPKEIDGKKRLLLIC